MNNLGVTELKLYVLNYDLSPTVFNIFGVKARITNSRAESKRTRKDFLTRSVNENALREVNYLENSFEWFSSSCRVSVTIFIFFFSSSRRVSVTIFILFI